MKIEIDTRTEQKGVGKLVDLCQKHKLQHPHHVTVSPRGQGWARKRSAEEMLTGQRQRVGVPAHARTARDGLPRKRLEDDLY